MASRRLRIKPVANVPIRRGRTAENVEKVEDKTQHPKELKAEEELSTVDSEHSSSGKSEDQNAEQINESNDTTQDSTSCAQDNPSAKTNSPVGVAKPPLFTRKRMRPAVNVAAVNRASKAQNGDLAKTALITANTVTEQAPSSHPTPSENQVSEKQKSDFPADSENNAADNHHTEMDIAISRVQDSDTAFDAADKSNPNVGKTTVRTLFRPSLNSSTLSNTTGKQSTGNSADKQKPARRYLKPAVNIAALSRTSRQQKSENLTNDREKNPEEPKRMQFSIPGITQLSPKVVTLESKHEKEPEITNESLPSDAVLPTETASVSGENSSCQSKPTTSWHKSRFAKPVPQIKAAHVRRISCARSSASNSESEDDSSKKSSLQQSHCTVPGYGSAGESDDDCQSLSAASTVSPPPKMARHSKLASLSSAKAPRQNRRRVSESEDDASRKTIGSASTITPPSRRLSEVSREEKEDKTEKKLTKPRVLSSSAVRFRKAKMEFFSKFNGHTTVDRSRLTMMDLIFYNPVTNPMKSSERKLSESSEKQPSAQVLPITKETEERLAEEEADDPEREEEDVALPVPQVKVGPDGQIVLDERSLVIETTGAKKNREDLANSAVIVDTGTTGNGFYRKYRKCKEWSQQETLKFYRALNIVGTDFLVMQSIFPKRSRRDLKMKFKREERINCLLVEKALRNPQDFDLTEMEKELAKEEEEEEKRKEKERLKSGKGKKMQEKGKKSTKKRSFLSRCMSDEEGEKTKRSRRKKKKIAKNRHTNKRGKSSESDEENEAEFQHPESQTRLSESEECTENATVGDNLPKAENLLTKQGENSQENKDREHDEDDDDDEEIKKELQFLTRPPRPTRSGRVPQQKRPLGVTTPTPKPIPKQGKPVLPLKDLSNIEPGSLVVIATQSPTNPGHQVYKVFMVAPATQTESAPTIAPVVLSPKLMQSNADAGAESNLKLYNSETLSFVNSQPISPAVSTQNVSSSVPLSCSTSNTNLHSLAHSTLESQEQCKALENQPPEPCSSTQVAHSLNSSPQSLVSCSYSDTVIIPASQSSCNSNPQQCTTSATNLQSKNTDVLSADVQFVPITKPQQQSLHTVDLNPQNMSIEASGDFPIQASQSETNFIPILHLQNSSPLQPPETSISPKSQSSSVIVPQFRPSVICLNTEKLSDCSTVKDSESLNSPAISTINGHLRSVSLSPKNRVKSLQVHATSMENKEEENNSRHSIENFGQQSNSVGPGSAFKTLMSEETSFINSSDKHQNISAMCPSSPEMSTSLQPDICSATKLTDDR